jgi:endonuclease YncB( thermonuclease family)
MIQRVICAALLLATIPAFATAESLIGRASIVDADTFDLAGKRIRILDIDTPEPQQLCTRPDGQRWYCGQQASLALADWIGQRTVACETTKKDRYKRWLARCSVGGLDVAEWLAAQGWGVPYRECKCEVVRAAADKAKLAKIGMWSGDFQMPWEWRRTNSGGLVGARSVALLEKNTQPTEYLLVMVWLL